MSVQTPAVDGLRIVLLGASGAGKSSLLGALDQAALTQQDLLGSQLTDTSGGLAELRKRTYEDKQAATTEESVAYAVSFQAGATEPATLIDCDGRVVQEYLDGKRALDASAGLAGGIKEADALVLLVAPAEPAQLEQSFTQFTQFLQVLKEQRGRFSEISGLPVYLVLTKCDLLARKDDTGTSWIQRIEDGKRNIGTRFQDFIEQARALPFGGIDLHLWATAIKRPALTDRPARPQEPYGVAELFRQVVDSARAFHRQRARAFRRLHLAVMSLVGLLAVLGLLTGGFFLSRPSAEVAALENSVRASLPWSIASSSSDPKAVRAAAAERLREPLDRKLKELTKIEEDSNFAGLPWDLQVEVRQARTEMSTYQALGKQIDALKRVRFFKKDEDIPIYAQEIDKLMLPPEYASQWADTRLAKKISQYKSELAALTKALAAEKDWLKKRTEEGEKLLDMTIPGKGSAERQAWINRADTFLKRKDLAKDVPGVPNMKLRDLYEFPSVNSLREDYEAIRPRVEKIRGGLL